jgi:hypothetical protein
VKYFFIIVIVLHGLIHLMGGLNELGLAKIEGLNNVPTLVSLSGLLKTLLGSLWFLAVFLFLLAGFGLLIGQAWWKMVALGAAILSQILIVIWWPAAKVGTIANILVVIALLLI